MFQISKLFIHRKRCTIKSINPVNSSFCEGHHCLDTPCATDESGRVKFLATEQCGHMEINEPRPVACHGSKRFRCDWFKSFLPVHSQVVRFFPWWHFYWMIHGSRNSDEPFFRGSCVFMRMVSAITEFMSSLEQQQSGCTLPYARSMCHMIKKMFAIVFNQWFPFDSQLMNL